MLNNNYECLSDSHEQGDTYVQLQELALYKEFTIEESFYYFGRIHNMRRPDIDEMRHFLVNLLGLPKKDSGIGNLR